jgi:hypothetical protein
MTRGPISRILALEAEVTLPIDAGDPSDQLRLPTLDERVSLFLRAVHGERDFTNKEYSEARGILLGAMATDIAAKTEIGSPDRTGALDTLFESGCADRIDVACASLVDYQDSHDSAPRLFEYSDTLPTYESGGPVRDQFAGPPKWSIASLNQRRREPGHPFEAAPSSVDVATFGNRALAAIQAFRASKRSVYIGAAVAAAGMLAILLTVWVGAGSNESRVALQSSQPDGSGEKLALRGLAASPMGSDPNSIQERRESGSRGDVVAERLLDQPGASALVKTTPAPQTFAGSVDRSNPSLNLSAAAEVYRVQQRLIELGYLLAPADGVWGPRSIQALNAFRAKAGLRGGRQWDRNTEDALFGATAPRATVLIPAPSRLAPR